MHETQLCAHLYVTTISYIWKISHFDQRDHGIFC